MKKIILLLTLTVAIHLNTKAQNNLLADAGYQAAFISKINYPNKTSSATTIYTPGDSTIVVKDYAYYMKKKRNNKIASFSLLGGGFIIAGIGALMYPKNYDLIWGNDAATENKANTATTVIVIGIAAMLTSIPFTILSSVNKRKANLMVTNQKTGFGVPANVSKDITGMTLRIPIGK